MTSAAMSDSELDDELSYHLRELHADLTLIRADLETVTSPDVDRSVARAWIQAEALLEHDLEVHFPRAFALLDSTMPPPPEPSRGRRAGDAASPTVIAREARRLVDTALAALPLEGGRAVVARKLLEAARLAQWTHQLATEMQQAFVGDDSSFEPTTR